MNTERNLLFALLAVRLQWLTFDDVRKLWPAWKADPEKEFADVLIESGRLAREDKVHIEYLLERTLQKHEADGGAGPATLFPEGPWQALLDTRDGMNRESVAALVPPPSPGVPPFADTALGEPPAAARPPAAPLEPARFTRLRLHASGGMGRVWLARDQRLERDVALKELRPEVEGHVEAGRRFLAEARITGRLEHPGIVPIYELVQEGSATAYVMRFLRGRTLSEAIKAYREKTTSAHLERAALLQVIVSICNTVAFAHSRGVWHRDLKGQNILLGDFGEVIVLDWGLAKEAGEAAEKERPPDVAPPPGGAGQTMAGQVMGTPYYMSPEQAAGETDRIDQRSDVYSLGAILYEILTGQAPFIDQTRHFGEKTIEAVLRRIRQEQPTRPRQLASEVPAPLQAICLRALAKDPADRYQSATDLAQEVQRWLADEPVHAHPDPWTVRAARWARRHRTMATSLGVLVIAVLFALAITTLLVNQEKTRTEEARTRAERNFHKAQEAVDRYFTQVSEDRLLNESGMLPLRKELLASALEFYEDFASEQRADPAGRWALGESQVKLARITRAMGEREDALRVLEEAQELFQQLATAHPDIDKYTLALGQSQVDHAYQSYLLKGRSPALQAELDRARAILSKLVEKNPTPLHRGELAHALNSLASYHEDFYKINDKAEAIKAAQKTEQAFLGAVSLWKQLAAEEPTPVRLKDLAGGYNNLAIVYGNLQDQEKCKDNLDQALAIRRQLAERYPQGLDYQENLAHSYNNFGIYYRDRGQLGQAEKAFRDALAIREKLARENCQVVQFQQGMAKTNLNLGNLYYTQVTGGTVGAARDTLFARGKEAYQRAVDVYGRLHDEHPQENRLRLDHAMALGFMGDLLSEEKKALAIPWYDRAIPPLEEALRQEETDAVRRYLRNDYWGRAEARADVGRFAEAVADWDRALALDDGSHKKDWLAKRAQARLEIIRQLAAKEGHHEKAAAAVEELLKDAPAPRLKVDLARVLALCTVIADDEKNTALVETYAARAVALVRQAYMEGYFQQNTGAPVLTVFRGIGPIARRADFQALAKEIEGKK